MIHMPEGQDALLSLAEMQVETPLSPLEFLSRKRYCASDPINAALGRLHLIQEFDRQGESPAQSTPQMTR